MLTGADKFGQKHSNPNVAGDAVVVIEKLDCDTLDSRGTATHRGHTFSTNARGRRKRDLASRRARRAPQSHKGSALLRRAKMRSCRGRGHKRPHTHAADNEIMTLAKRDYVGSCMVSKAPLNMATTRERKRSPPQPPSEAASLRRVRTRSSREAGAARS